MIKKVYTFTSPLPLVAHWVLMKMYYKGSLGTGPLAGTAELGGTIVLSLLMGSVGLVLIEQARRNKKPVAYLWASTLLAGSVFIYSLAIFIWNII